MLGTVGGTTTVIHTPVCGGFHSTGSQQTMSHSQIRPSTYVCKVLLEPSYTHFFTYCLWLLSCYWCWVVEQRLCHPHSLTTFYPAFHRKACWPLYRMVVRDNNHSQHGCFSYCSVTPLLSCLVFLTFHHYSFSSPTCLDFQSPLSPVSSTLLGCSWFVCFLNYFKCNFFSITVCIQYY